MPRLRLKRVAENQLAALAPHVREEIDLALLRIQADPEHEGIELLGTMAGRWRKRVGGYRILYRIRENGRLSASTRSGDVAGPTPSLFRYVR